MHLATWDPFRELEGLMERYGRDRNPMRAPAERSLEKMAASDWHPLVDVSEDGDGYHIHAELPGVKREDVALTVEDGVLSIRGKRESRREEGGGALKFHRVERAYGSFARSFRLPEDADADAVSAVFRDGVLEVLLPRCEAKRSRTIEIKGAG